MKYQDNNWFIQRDLLSDITRAEIILDSLQGDYKTAQEAKIVLHGKTKETIRLKPMRSLFGNDFKINECGKSGCAIEYLSPHQKRTLETCNYEGHMDSDKESRVNVVMCSDSGDKDIFIVSKKVGRL